MKKNSSLLGFKTAVHLCLARTIRMHLTTKALRSIPLAWQPLKLISSRCLSRAMQAEMNYCSEAIEPSLFKNGKVSTAFAARTV
jgi:hypothetical protein